MPIPHILRSFPALLVALVAIGTSSDRRVGGRACQPIAEADPGEKRHRWLCASDLQPFEAGSLACEATAHRWPPACCHGCRSTLPDRLCDTAKQCRACLDDLWSDYDNYYSCHTGRSLLWGVAVGSILANTSLDQDFQDWYQEDVRSDGLDNLASFWRPLGDGEIYIPAFAGLAVIGALCDDCPLGRGLGDFGTRTVRAYGVGAPPMLFMQYALGASRPGETHYQSRWKPLDDSNAVSGHAFVGAVPFITAAKMTDDPVLKGGLYFCSTMTAWSRVNDDRHYMSQACLGWWMAYLACQAVQKTESDPCLALVPVSSPEMVGVRMVLRR
jgi:hypothetical protein